MRVPFPSTGSALRGLNILLVSKEGAPKAFITACQDVRQRYRGVVGLESCWQSNIKNAGRLLKHIKNLA